MKNNNSLLGKSIFLIVLLIILEFSGTIALYKIFPNTNMVNGVQFIIDLSLFSICTIGALCFFTKIKTLNKIDYNISEILIICVVTFIWVIMSPLFKTSIISNNFSLLNIKFCFSNFFIEKEFLSTTNFYIFYRSILVTPILEEYLFRNLILTKLNTRYGFKKSIIITSILFSISHLDINNIFIFFIGSLILCYMFLKTNKLIYSILLHIFMNILVLILC